MKSIKLSIMALALAGVALFSSCGGDKEAAPTVSIVTPSSSTGEHKKGDKIDFTVSVTGENKLTSIKSTSTEGTSTTEISSKTDGFADKTSDDFTFSYEITSAPGSVITITVEATDKFDNVGTATYTITVKEEIEERTAVIMSGQNNSTGSGQFYSVANSVIYNLANAKTNSANVDFCYAHRSDANGARMITAPSSNNATDIYGSSSVADNVTSWATRNATKIRLTSLTSADFDAVKEASKVTTEANALTTSDLTASTLTVGKVFVFETAAGKKGLGRVEAVAGSAANSSTGDIYNSTDNSITIKFKLIK